ncbi:MAG: GNAT family N-acetyltransferase [Parvibaculaceae bacterium]
MAPDLERVDAVRQFNRFYTGRLGLLRDRLYDSAFSLPQMRVLYEIAHRPKVTAAELARDLNMDPGYLSRQLRRFSEDGLVKREASPRDGREQLLALTSQGRRAFGPCEEASRREVAEMLAHLDPQGLAEVATAMRRLERLLAPEASSPEIALRPHKPGDMGWVVERHASLYWDEYRFDERFEALVAGIVSRFIEEFDPRREACWIAEMEGERVGSVFLVRQSEDVAKLRLLIVDPKARGQGLGRRLVQETVRFAEGAGYRKIVLWTQSILTAARAIYEREGFRLTASEPNESFGQSLISETWELDLA